MHAVYSKEADMEFIRVIYHCESEGWWADSPNVEGWSATAPSLDELRDLVEEGVRFALGRTDEVLIQHLLEDQASSSPFVVFDFVAGRTDVLHSDVESETATATLAVA